LRIDCPAAWTWREAKRLFETACTLPVFNINFTDAVRDDTGALQRGVLVNFDTKLSPVGDIVTGIDKLGAKGGKALLLSHPATWTHHTCKDLLLKVADVHVHVFELAPGVSKVVVNKKVHVGAHNSVLYHQLLLTPSAALSGACFVQVEVAPSKQ
jgi:hypothetical protein